MKDWSWETTWARLAAAGWHLDKQRDFLPMFGRYWKVSAFHPESGRRHRVEGANLRLAVKKLEAAILKEKARGPDL